MSLIISLLARLEGAFDRNCQRFRAGPDLFVLHYLILAGKEVFDPSPLHALVHGLLNIVLLG